MSDTEREYVPTTEQVRATIAVFDNPLDPRLKGEFDRWLAQHDAQVRAETLREAADEWKDAIHWANAEKWLRDRAARIVRDVGGEG